MRSKERCLVLFLVQTILQFNIVKYENFMLIKKNKTSKQTKIYINTILNRKYVVDKVYFQKETFQSLLFGHIYIKPKNDQSY